MVELFDALRFSYGWTLRVFLVLVWFDSQRPHGNIMVGLLRAPRFSYVLHIRGPPVFVWLDS